MVRGIKAPLQALDTPAINVISYRSFNSIYRFSFINTIRGVHKFLARNLYRTADTPARARANLHPLARTTILSRVKGAYLADVKFISRVEARRSPRTRAWNSSSYRLAVLIDQIGESTSNYSIGTLRAIPRRVRHFNRFSQRSFFYSLHFFYFFFEFFFKSFIAPYFMKEKLF